MRSLRNIVALVILLIGSSAGYAQCCGDGVCDPGETPLNCPYDCGTTGFNCPNTVGPFFDAPIWPVGLAMAQDSGWCYSYTAPFPTQVCFEYIVPPANQPWGVSLLINSCSLTNLAQFDGGGGGCLSLSFIFDPSVSGLLSLDANCNTIANNLTMGACTGLVPGDIGTVCILLDTAAVGLCTDTLTICPTVSCGSFDCASTGTSGCPPFGFTGSTTGTSCYGGIEDGTATVVPPCGTHFNYLWNDPMAQTTNTAIGLAPGTYSVVITNTAFNCDTTMVLTIDAPSFPSAIIQPADTFNCLFSSQILDGSASSSGLDISYSWTTLGGNIVSGSTTDSPTVNEGGNYQLIVTDSVNGCTDTAFVTVFVDTLAPVAFFVADPNSGAPPLNVQFANGSTGNGLTYEWDFGDGTPIDTSIDPDHIYGETGTFIVTLTITDINGCTGTYTFTIIVDGTFEIFIPNVFSPNGDGMNDEFQVLVDGFNKYELNIYNRWGILVKNSGSPGNGWDGYTPSGQQVPEGVYYYTIIVQDNFNATHTYTGHLQLLR